jgi:peptidyl-prolyl cis-trans isomerase C
VIGVVLFGLSISAAACLAQETRPADEGAVVATPPPAEAPASRPAGAVVAKVGSEQVLIGDVDRLFIRQINQLRQQTPGAPIPPEQLEAEWNRALAQAISSKQVSAHLASLPISQEALAAHRQELANSAKESYNMDLSRWMAAVGMSEEDLTNEAKLSKLIEESAGKQQIDALIAASPALFDGTTVKASHILIASEEDASPEVKAAARKKLEDLSVQIAMGKITFEDAAKANSDCPSKAQGGDLGDFTFDRMVVPFSEAAFAMEVGQTSGVVESSFGMHLIKVTGRTPGSGKPTEAAAQVAAGLLRHRLQQEFFAAARQAHPAVMTP